MAQALLVSAAAAEPVAGAQAPAQRLEELLRQGQAAEAVAQGLSLLPEHAGDPQFDFAFGLAALEAGRYDHATLAFRRVLLVRPDSDRARLELGRVYYLAGDDAAARAEFRQVLRREPPPQVADRIYRFLDAIDKRERVTQPRLTPSLALRFGHDDNVGNATDRDIFLVALPGIPLSARREQDAFGELNAGLDYQRPLNKRWGVFAGGGYSHRAYQSVDGFDLQVVDVRGGVVRAGRSGRLRLPVQLQWLGLDGEHYRSLGSVGAQWTRPLDRRTELGLFGQLAMVRFPDMSERDVNGANLGLALARRTDGGLQISGGVFAGTEDAVESRGDYNGRNFFGARLALSWPLNAQHSLEGVTAYQNVSFAEVQPMFGLRRDDEVLQFELAWQWRPTERWEWRTAALYYDSRSSISLYDYDRLQLITGVRYVWK